MARRSAKNAAAKPKLYHVAVGTRSEMARPRDYTTLDAAKGFAQDNLLKWEAWCNARNKAGLQAIYDAKAWVDEIHDGTLQIARSDAVRVECVFDEHTGMHIVIEMWKG